MMTEDRRCRVWYQGGLCALPYHHEGIHRNLMHIEIEGLQTALEESERRAQDYSRCLGIARGMLQVIANGQPDKWEAGELARDGLLESAPTWEREKVPTDHD
jgi:hypothetical protein